MQLLSLKPRRKKRLTREEHEKGSSETQHPQGAARVAKHFVACAGAASKPRGRAKPGARGGGGFFRIETAPGRRFIAFRYHDVGKKEGVERVASQRPDRTWDTAGWLLSKDLAHVERGRLVPDTVDARKVLSALGATRHVGGDRFQAEDRPQSSRSTAQHSQRRGGERVSALITWSARAVRLGRMRRIRAHH
jgi:hypothetical protein